MTFEGLDQESARSFAEKWLPAWSGNRPELLASFYTDDAFFDRSELLRAIAGSKSAPAGA